MKKKVNNNSLRKSVIVTIAFVMISVMLLSFGYARFSATASIEDIMAKVRPTGNAIVSAFTASTLENGGSSSSLGYNIHNIYGTIDLPNQDSSVTFKVDVTVLLSPEMKIANITGLDSNLEYSFSNYTLGQPLCNTNDECNLGATDELYMTISYKSGGYNSSSTTYAFNLDFDFQEVNYVAKIGNTRYTSLSDAIQAVPTTNVETTVTLLKNTSEVITVNRNQNVKLNLQTFTISNSGNNPIFSNNGTVTITNGTITSDTVQGAFNNESHGTLIMSGGKIMTTGTKQAIYNNGGLVEISGNAYLSSTSDQRAVITNLTGGRVTITGGTIKSTGFSGIDNSGNLTIGVKDGNISKTTPSIQGLTYGVNATTSFNYYDGVIKGQTNAINNESLVSDKETGTYLLHSMENSYKKVVLGVPVIVTFNPNGGTVTEGTREVDIGSEIGILPIPTRNGFDFMGWFTDPDYGTEVLSDTIINSAITLYAHWEVSHVYVANVNGTDYEVLQDAVNTVPTNNTKVVITILHDIDNENIVVRNNQKIEFDIGSYTISNTSGIIIDNSGTIEIKNGKLIRNGANDQKRVIYNRSSGNVTISGGEIKSNAHQAIQNYGTLNITGGKIWVATSVDQGVINNENNGILNVSGGEIVGTKRQAIYNDGGTLTISGNPTLSNGYSATANRACVQNHRGTTTISGGTITSPSTSYPAVLNESTMTITGGTITSSAQNGVNNTSNLTIGVKDGNINTSAPTIRGTTYGVKNTSTFKYYDGTIKGVSASINGTVTEIEDNSTRVDGTEVIDNVTYQTAHLE